MAAPNKLQLVQLGANEFHNGVQSLIHLGCVLAAAHCGVGLAAAGTAADGADMLDDLASLDTSLNCSLAADSQEGQLVTVQGSQNSNDGLVLITQDVAHLTQLACISAGDLDGQDLDSADGSSASPPVTQK